MRRGGLALATEAAMKAEFAEEWSNEATFDFERVRDALTSACTGIT
jgi:hypothetical protein